MIRDVGESVGEAIAGSVGRMVGHTQERCSLPADLLEDDEAYVVIFDAPGVEPGDVNVEFDDGAVHVRLDRFRDVEEGFEMRFPGRGLTLEGRKRLPPGAAVDPDRASASLRDNGTLAVRLPKSEPSQAADAEEPGHNEADGDDAE